MANKQQVIELHRQYPAWTSKQIAEAILGPSAKDFARLVKTDGYVRATGQRKGLSFSKVPARVRAVRPDSFIALGRACRAAGLTLADIIEISKT